MLGKLLAKTKDQIAYVILGRFAKDAAEGKFGTKIQSAYQWSVGKKTYTGMVLALILGAVEYFQPDLHGTALHVLTGIAVGLAGLGLIDKAYRNEPVFPTEFLDSVARISAALLWIQGSLLPFVGDVLQLIAPGCNRCDGIQETVELYLSAGFAAVAFVNRLARASQTAPAPKA